MCRCLCFWGLQLYQKRDSGTGVFLWILRFFFSLQDIFFIEHLWWLLLQSLSTKKYFKMKWVYITINMFHVLLSCTSVYLSMWRFRKSAEHFASYETIKCSKQVINNLFLSEFLNAWYTTSKLMSYKGNGKLDQNQNTTSSTHGKQAKIQAQNLLDRIYGSKHV